MKLVINYDAPTDAPTETQLAYVTAQAGLDGIVPLNAYSAKFLASHAPAEDDVRTDVANRATAIRAQQQFLEDLASLQSQLAETPVSRNALIRRLGYNFGLSALSAAGVALFAFITVVSLAALVAEFYLPGAAYVLMLLCLCLPLIIWDLFFGLAGVMSAIMVPISAGIAVGLPAYSIAMALFQPGRLFANEDVSEFCPEELRSFIQQLMQLDSNSRRPTYSEDFRHPNHAEAFMSFWRTKAAETIEKLEVTPGHTVDEPPRLFLGSGDMV